jgi:hypothetical protein
MRGDEMARWRDATLSVLLLLLIEALLLWVMLSLPPPALGR